jgi:signal transduction histidine kinase
MMDQQRIVAALERAFPGLSQAELEDLAQVGRVVRYPANTVIFEEGSIGHSLYVILDGWVRLSKYFQAGAPRVLHDQCAGEFFGEMALIQNRPRAASVHTLEASTLLELSEQAFNGLLDRNPTVALTVMRKLTSRLRDADQMTITDLRQKNLELAQAYERLAEQQRRRSEFLTTIAHELRTPLTSIQGYLQLMRPGTLPPEQAVAMAPVIERNVSRIVDLVNNILFLQELELITPQLEPLMVGELVTRAVGDVQHKAAEHDLRLKIDIAPKLPQVQADVEGLGRAITALLDNAIKFSPEGGEIQVLVTQHNGDVCIEIADPGVGIPEEHLERLFEPFDRVESSGGHLFEGVGLGLPIAKHVVEMHGGRILAERRREGGSRFTIVLPLPGD